MKYLIAAALISTVFASGRVDANLTNCSREYHGGKILQTCTGYTTSPRPDWDQQAIYVKCDGWWPVTDYYAYSDWASRHQPAEVNCGTYRTPRYVRTVQR